MRKQQLQKVLGRFSKLVFIFTFVLSITFSDVKADPKTDETNNVIETEIRNLITYPTVLKGQIGDTERVNLRFTIDENGKIVVVAISGASDELANYISQQLNGKEFKNVAVVPGKNYRMNISFVVL